MYKWEAYSPFIQGIIEIKQTKKKRTDDKIDQFQLGFHLKWIAI